MQNTSRHHFGIRSAIVAAIFAAACASVQAHGSSADVSGSNSVNSVSGAIVNVSGAGSALVEASNRGSAYTQVQSGGTAGFTTRPDGGLASQFGNVEIGGITRTTNTSFVNTVVHGSGQALGGALGLSQAEASGSGQFHTDGNGPIGSVAGGTRATTGSGVISIGNGTATRTGGMVSEFGAGAGADITFQTTGTPGGVAGMSDIKNAYTSGFASGIAMNAAPGSNTQMGRGMGGLTNDASAFGGGISSVAGQVSASHR